MPIHETSFWREPIHRAMKIFTSLPYEKKMKSSHD
ncbi:hypothetical protein TcasGA2_TC033062 [Tribolium castaneum]|uniref:Uncharacterized protein n=1 Tax=Tribolium castaneum TaxID=7070 RepID=A0A139WID8_TRICA|nr:hypothetical protein TcasGA2_TC033062 [Tribolium castaneum]